MSLENYKKKFYILSESKLGNSKPLLMEQGEKRNTLAIHSKTLSNVCVEIPTKDIISKESDTLQLSWFSPTVLRHIVTC
jgi:hypothetical protein